MKSGISFISFASKEFHIMSAERLSDIGQGNALEPPISSYITWEQYYNSNI